MAKKTLELDTPFRKGEKVLTTRDLADIDQGTAGKIKVANGLGEWRRYWVMFDGGELRGQVSHEDLVRPKQLQDWLDRQERRAQEALRSEEEAVAEVEAADSGGGDSGDGGIASQIPAHLLERSKAAKTRLLG